MKDEQRRKMGAYKIFLRVATCSWKSKFFRLNNMEKHFLKICPC